MIKNIFLCVLIFAAAIALQSVSLAAEVINLPEEELAKESVLPVFREKTTVKNRNVVTEGRWEAQASYGYAMTEPIFNVSKLGVGIYYNFNEDHALGLLWSQNMSGLSDYAQQLKEEIAGIGQTFENAPKPKAMILADYNLKAFYGKMSLTKNTVINSILFVSAGAGVAQYENKSYPAISGGLGQKFYFTKNFSLRADLRLQAHQAPIPFKKQTEVSYSERVHYFTVLDLGFSYLF